MFRSRLSRLFGGLLLGLAGSLCAATTAAANQGFSALALRGVAAVTVSVEGVRRDYARYGLTADELQARLTSRLAAAGIEVISETAANTDPRASQLRALVTAYEGSYSLISYRVAIELQRKLPLDASGQSFVAQTVWSQGRGGILNPSDLTRIYGYADELLDHFVADYGTQNGSTTTGARR